MSLTAYVGQGRITEGCKVVAKLKTFGLGVCVCPGEKLPPVVRPMFCDNGAFRDWDNGRPWDGDRFAAFVEEARALEEPPDFVVAPDVVGGGLASLELSLSWVERLAGLKPYLAVQDGMREGDVLPVLDRFAGLFVGGSLAFKFDTGARWVALAHARGLRCHVGRIGTPSRVAWAREVGADSIDSSSPLWSAEKLAAWVAAVHAPDAQGRLFA